MPGIFHEKGFGTFWTGPLSAMEQACLASIVNRGYQLTLFSYEPIQNVPKGVALENAADIAPRHMMERFFYNGKADITHFSDYFRIQMMGLRDLIWVDADILMIRDNVPLPYPDILAREGHGDINNAILYLSDPRMIDAVRAETLTKSDKDLDWGETGPRLLTAVMAKQDPLPQVYGHELFYPIIYVDFWKMLLPRYRQECEEVCKDAVTLHLFNHILLENGYVKHMAPPKGSYLYDMFDSMNLLGPFQSIHSAKAMEVMAKNYRKLQKLQNSKPFDPRALIRACIPGPVRALKRRLALHHNVLK